jgi:integrase/recombinase XerC
MGHLGPRTLTTDEQRALLRVSAAHARDHLIISLALGSGLRLGELVGLDVGDLFFPTGEPRLRVAVRPEIAKRGRVGDVFLPDALLPKLRRFWIYKLEHGERVEAHCPLLCNQSRRRMSARRVQTATRAWQARAGFYRLYPFHALRPIALRLPEST